MKLLLLESVYMLGMLLRMCGVVFLFATLMYLVMLVLDISNRNKFCEHFGKDSVTDRPRVRRCSQKRSTYVLNFPVLDRRGRLKCKPSYLEAAGWSVTCRRPDDLTAVAAVMREHGVQVPLCSQERSDGETLIMPWDMSKHMEPDVYEKFKDGKRGARIGDSPVVKIAALWLVFSAMALLQAVLTSVAR